MTLKAPRLSLLLILAAGCNRYEYFNLAGYAQADFTNDADILFVIDNSLSMVDETGAIGLNFTSFIDTLTSDEGSAQSSEDLGDAVDNFIEYSQDRSRYVNYQLAITTTSVEPSGGPTAEVDPGEVGLLLGDPPVLSKFDEKVDDAFRQNLLCHAIPWDEDEVPSDLSYQCGDPVEVITQEYLDCECGLGAWESNSGTGNEEPLEAALLALCRSADDPPEACYHELSPFTDADINSNDTAERPFLREDSAVILVIVGDEGDNSRQMQQGDTDPQVYLDAFESFGHTVRVAVIGPDYDPDEGELACNSGGATTWAVERLQSLADTTGGLYAPLTDDDCGQADFSETLTQLGQLVNNLLTAFQLQSIPDVETIRVFVDDVEIAQSTEADVEDAEEEPLEYTRGWSYDSAQNAVVFWGDDIPDYGADVRIFYLPLVGKPREVPFEF